MARRNDHTRDELKELILESTVNLIKKEGILHLSTRKVAAKIGYSVGTLYNVFGNYDDIILHVNERTLDDWYAYMDAALKQKTDKNLLLVLAESYYNYAKANYNLWVVLFEHHFDGRLTLPEWYLKKIARFLTLVEDSLSNFNLDTQSKNLSAKLLWAGVHGITILSLTNRLDTVGDESSETLIKTFISDYLAGIEKKPKD